MALYFDSTLDLETVVCFFDDYKIKLSPKKCNTHQRPDPINLDHLQNLNHKRLTTRINCFRLSIKVALTNLRILFVAVIWEDLDVCKK